MSARAKTYAEFAHDAAETVQIIICQMRIIRAKSHGKLDRDSALGLSRLEDTAGDHAPQRSAECGDCIGCPLIASRTEIATLH
jgi:hypothetical protein